MKVADEQWDEEYAGGRWQFLDNPEEQMRHACIASFIATYTPGEVLDLGCGPAHLLQWVKPGSVTRYTGVDVSEVALTRVPDQEFPVEKIVESVSEFDPGPRRADILIASEVLYFVEDPAAEIKRIVDACDYVGAVAISLVAPNEAKPNWERASNRVWSEIGKLGWQKHHSVRVRHDVSGTGWDLAFYLIDAKA